MTRIDFYVLGPDSAQNTVETVCRLIEKARNKDKSVFVHTEDDQLVATLDAALWDFRADSFIPHQTLAGPLDNSGHATHPQGSLQQGSAAVKPDLSLDNAQPEAVEIACRQEPMAFQARSHSILINLGLDVPAFFSRFERTLEIVSPAEEHRIAGRKRYSYYKERGYPVNHHNI